MDPSEASSRLQVVLAAGNDGWGFVRGSGIRHSFGRHAHASLTLGMVLSGHRRILCDEESWEIGPGEAFAIAPWKAHRCICQEPQGHDYLVISVSPELLSELAVGAEALSCPRSGPLPDMPSLRGVFACAAEGTRDSRGFRHALEVFLGRCRRQGLLVDARGLPPLCDDACRYLVSLLDENVSLDELADHVGASPYYFHRLFRAGTGVAPHEWHLQARVRASVDRLLSCVSIQKVALDLGFSDQSHFTRVFHRAMGVSPGRLDGAPR